MRVGHRTLFPASPPENERWTVEVVSQRTLLWNRVRDVIWPNVVIGIMGLAGLTFKALSRGGPGKLLWLGVGVVTFTPVLVVWERQRRALLCAVEKDTRRHIGKGTARARGIEMLHASAYVRKNKPAAQPPLIEVHLFRGEGGAIEVWVDSRESQRSPMVEIGLPANVTGLILCTRRGSVAGISFADTSGRVERLRRLGRGSLVDSESSIAEFKANLDRLSLGIAPSL